jgi:transketolase C-terminal domain/subunit
MIKMFELKPNKNIAIKMSCGVTLICATYISFHNIFVGLGLAVVSILITYSVLSKKGSWFS